MRYSPLPKPLHEYVCTLSLKGPQILSFWETLIWGGGTHCSPLLIASKTLPFPFLWLGCVFWLNTHQEANPVSGHMASKSHSGYARICTSGGDFPTCTPKRMEYHEQKWQIESSFLLTTTLWMRYFGDRPWALNTPIHFSWMCQI